MVFLDTFEGPLDLLLYLIRRRNLDLLEMSVSAITDQYMGYIELMKALELDLAAEYLVMAATLTAIKSACCCRAKRRRRTKRTPAPNCFGACMSTSASRPPPSESISCRASNGTSSRCSRSARS